LGSSLLNQTDPAPAATAAAARPTAVVWAGAYNLVVPAGAPSTAVVATFRTDGREPVSAVIAWGDGSSSGGVITPDGAGGFRVAATTSYQHVGTYAVTMRLTALGRAPVALTVRATVLPPDELTSTGESPPGPRPPDVEFNGSESPAEPAPAPAPPPVSGQLLWARTADPRPTADTQRSLPPRALAPPAFDPGAPVGLPESPVAPRVAPAAEPRFMPGYLVALEPVFPPPATVRGAVHPATPPPAEAPTPRTAGLPRTGMEGEAVAAFDPAPVAAVPAASLDDWHGERLAAAPVVADDAGERRNRGRPGWLSYLPLVLLVTLWERAGAGDPPRPTRPRL
jgi:hypothetical protein